MASSHILKRSLLSLSLIGALGAIGCGQGEAEGGDGVPGAADAIVNVVPGDPGWRPVSPPDAEVCIGKDPGAEAFERSRRIARAAAAARAAEASRDARSEAPGDDARLSDVRSAGDTREGDTREGDIREGDTTEDDTTEDDATEGVETAPFDLPPIELPPEEPEDPCAPVYTDVEACIGTVPPDFLAYDFQPQSCGYGGTYGLDVFRGEVTFVALFASW